MCEGVRVSRLCVRYNGMTQERRMQRQRRRPRRRRRHTLAGVTEVLHRVAAIAFMLTPVATPPPPKRQSGQPTNAQNTRERCLSTSHMSRERAFCFPNTPELECRGLSVKLISNWILFTAGPCAEQWSERLCKLSNCTTGSYRLNGEEMPGRREQCACSLAARSD